MGTPAFACKPLMALHESRHEIRAIVTGTDKRRGRKVCPTEVCQSAESLGLPVLTPKSLKSNELYEELKAYQPDLFVVVAFRILPERLFSLPRYGSINIHASLLPSYRGAAPIHWALINGEKETGLTSFFLDRTVDTGNVILQERAAIADTDTYDTLSARLSDMSGPFLLKTLDLIERPDFEPRNQDDSKATPAPKIKPFDALIDFGFPANRVHNFVRGLSSNPGAYTWFRGKKIKVLGGRVASETGVATARPGSVIQNRKKLLIQCANSAIEITSLLPEGKKLMDGGSFVNGFRPEAGELFGEIPPGGKE
jgi:methionyl-tRNA formyltransferase